MKTKIIPCICTPDYNRIISMTDGMPVLVPSDDMVWWDIKCPKCGRGNLISQRSPYLAVKEWNKIQTRERNLIIFD